MKWPDPEASRRTSSGRSSNGSSASRKKKALGDDIKEVYAEAKANGFDVKTLRQVIRLRKQDTSERAEQEALLDLYLHALGMVRRRELSRQRVVQRLPADWQDDTSP